MTTDSNQSAGDASTGTGELSETEAKEVEERRRRWILVIIVVPVVLIVAALLLVGLPLGTIMVMNSSGCCLTSGTDSMLTFWASMIAGFLALFGMVVTAVFIITAFRVDATAQAKAQVEALKAVRNYLKHEQAEFAKDLDRLKAFMKRAKEKGESAQKAIAKAQQDVETQQKTANDAIVDARNAASQAQDAVAKALEKTTNAADAAQDAIGKAVQGVQSQHDEAIHAIDGARQEAEAAAKEVQERADRSAEGPTPPEGDGPEDPR